MKIRTGCDIVEIKRFSATDKKVLGKIFTKNELKNAKAESLAGIFAVKESVRKIFNELDWHDVEVRKLKNGKPDLILHKKKSIISSDISISHDGEYAIAVALFLIK